MFRTESADKIPSDEVSHHSGSSRHRGRAELVHRLAENGDAEHMLALESES